MAVAAAMHLGGSIGIPGALVLLLFTILLLDQWAHPETSEAGSHFRGNWANAAFSCDSMMRQQTELP